jgi:hypothetical protein
MNMRGPGRKIFDLPVYRSTADKYYSEREHEENKLVQSIGLDPARHKEQILGVSQSLFERWRPWAYNEAVGWIEIRAEPSRIVGSLYFTASRITRTTRAKRVFWQGKLFEFHVFPDETPVDICQNLKRVILENVAATGSLRGRYIDFEALDSLCPHIDWCSLLSHQYRTP